MTCLYDAKSSSISLWLGYDLTLQAFFPSHFWFPSNRTCWITLRSVLKYHQLLEEFQGPPATQRKLKQLCPEIWCMDSDITRPRSFVTLNLSLDPPRFTHSFISRGWASRPEVSSRGIRAPQEIQLGRQRNMRHIHCSHACPKLNIPPKVESRHFLS